jgi:hypothetical protein
MCLEVNTVIVLTGTAPAIKNSANQEQPTMTILMVLWMKSSEKRL